MVKTEAQAQELLTRYLKHNCTKQEIALVEGWYNHQLTIMLDSEENTNWEQTFEEQEWVKIAPGRQSIYKMSFGKYVKAAALLVAIIVAASLFYFNHHSKTDAAVTARVKEIMPGSNKAVLTLADGKKIDLNTVPNGKVASQPGVIITKSGKGQLVYQTDAGYETTQVMATNTLEVPLGGQYEVILPDGSKAYLNAGSKLTYATRFTGNERNVSLIGEGYFEIVKNAKRPFKVVSSSQIISVVGTHFNVSCYPEEPVRTTLLEGKVNVLQSATGHTLPLVPGQQAITTDEGISMQQVNAADAKEWVNGSFVFTQTPIKDALSQIGRWYDVDIDYNSLPAKKTLEVRCSRNLPLQKLLDNISSVSGIKLVLDGRSIKAR